MTDASPTPPNRQDPHLDPADDSDEPAFDWMKPSTGKQSEPPAAKTATTAAATEAPGQTPVAAAGTAAPDNEPSTEASAQASGAAPTEQSATVPLDTLASGRSRQGRRADLTAEEDALTPSGKVRGADFNERLPTSALQIRPPEAEVERRNAEREAAAKAKPILPRVMQVMLAVFYPVILLVLAVRTVASPLFLWVEYHRPGFPGDGYGFNTDDRMTYGSYAVDYLTNWAGPRYLGDLISRSGDTLFQEGEVSHMADVKFVIQATFAAGAVLILLGLIAVIYLRRRSAGGVRRGLFAGSILTLTIIIGLGALAVLNWEQFFTEFHRVFFASGTWTFSLQDTLIRLFPGQFWVDAGIVIGALVVLASLITLIFTWPTRKRRGLAGDTGRKANRSKEAKARNKADEFAADGSADATESARPADSSGAGSTAAAGSSTAAAGRGAAINEDPARGTSGAR